MKLKTVISLAFISALLLSGCGDSKSTNPILPSESGSNSLLVNAEVNGSDAGSGLFTTQFIVTLLDSLNAPVTNANISITHAVLGATVLTWDTLTASDYKASVSGYSPGTYTLNIQRGTDYLYNGRVSAPDIHIITYPALNDTIPLNTAITALWTRTTIAELVEVETRDFGPVLSTAVGDTDDGSFIISGSSTVRDDQRVRITRSNDITLTRGLTGSSFKAGIRNSVEPLVQM